MQHPSSPNDARAATPPLSLGALELSYHPFPIGLARGVFSDARYAQLLATYPPCEIFGRLDKVGTKLSLSEKYNGRHYATWIREHPAWREFHAWVKSPEFLDYVLETLRERRIDLGVDHGASRPRRWLKRLDAFVRGGTALKAATLRTRFEFSMLPARGGCILPHTDNPSKLVTLVVSMVDPTEWKPEYGGATEICRPLDETQTFNRQNRQIGFDEVETIGAFPFQPNQALLFVKTFNSWHCVRPMAASDELLMRRTLTLNIEVAD